MGPANARHNVVSGWSVAAVVVLISRTRAATAPTLRRFVIMVPASWTARPIVRARIVVQMVARVSAETMAARVPTSKMRAKRASAPAKEAATARSAETTVVVIPVARALGMTSVKVANVSAFRTAHRPVTRVVMTAVEGAVGVALSARAVQAEPASATHNVRVRNAATPGPPEAVSSS